MVYDVLNRLKRNKKLYSCSMTVSRPEAVDKRGFVFGREIVDFNASCIIIRGGETGYEEFSVPLEDVLTIESEGRVVFRRKPRIEKVYPR